MQTSFHARTARNLPCRLLHPEVERFKLQLEYAPDSKQTHAVPKAKVFEHLVIGSMIQFTHSRADLYLMAEPLSYMRGIKSLLHEHDMLPGKACCSDRGSHIQIIS